MVRVLLVLCVLLGLCGLLVLFMGAPVADVVFDVPQGIQELGKCAIRLYKSIV
ncbi:hypothetical protein [Streptomyces sp. NPDC087300]|uniref:hypothetical protein n=1 Tax=Streptomyces sp. NPDC087300 TaxID=3365780 RepID=UPI00380B1FE7